MCAGTRRPEEGDDGLELDFQMVVSHHVTVRLAVLFPDSIPIPPALRPCLKKQNRPGVVV